MACSDEEKATLLSIALESINSGLKHGMPVRLNCGDYPERLTQRRASFVSLKRGGALRGCIGMLEARTSLVESVADNAYAAAFRDPRFAPLGDIELDDLTIEVSVLSPLTRVSFDSEQALLEKMIPGEAGWVLQDDGYKGTFLPSVWSSLKDPVDYLQQLKIKAGLGPDYWSETLEAWCYTTDSFASPATEIARSGHATINAG
jgi:AmmeMemoRadiSam system protein A